MTNVNWPRTARNVMEEIAGRIGTPLDPRTQLGGDEIEDTALEMTMREIAGYIAAINAGNWTITDEGKLYLVPIVAAQLVAEISAHNVESLSVSDPLEAWSGVRVVWDGEEWDASVPEQGEDPRPVKRGDVIGSAGTENGRVLEIKVAFGQRAVADPSKMWDGGARNILQSIQGNAYCPFEARNAILDPAVEIGDAVTIPGGTSVICSLSGELDGLCAVDASAPPDEAINTAYPLNWLKAQGGGESLKTSDIEQAVTDAWNATFD